MAVVEVMDSTEHLKAWAKMIAATTAVGFVLGATAALFTNGYTGRREVIAPAFISKIPALPPDPTHQSATASCPVTKGSFDHLVGTSECRWIVGGAEKVVAPHSISGTSRR
jgi:hypothetical protein